jgi:hypothetical protein
VSEAQAGGCAPSDVGGRSNHIAAHEDAGVMVLRITQLGERPAEIVEKLKAWSE